MPKNHYLVLGVTADASREEIKAAFRRRALESHPERAGLLSESFLEIQEAYAVLGDPERRQRYNRQTSAVATRHRPWGPAPEPLTARQPAGGPLRAVAPGRSFREASLAESFETYRPSIDELFARLRGNFETLSRPKAEQLESLTVELVVSAEEARWGGRVRLWIPAQATCATCGGHGAVGAYECWQCEGHGALTTEYPVEVDYPPGLREGYAVRIPLTRFGIENFYLTVLFRVS